MVNADLLFRKDGPLAKVWLAASMENKLTKNQIIASDVVQHVKDIMRVQQDPLALRVSGQLLLGVCRIHSRKQVYLSAEATEALSQIKIQTRPRLVDLAEDQLAAPHHDLDMDDGDRLGMDLDWNMGLPNFYPASHAGDDHDDIDFGGTDSQYLNVGPSDGFQSQDFALDLGLLDDEDATVEGDDTLSAIEIGRDVAPARSARLSMGSKFGGGADDSFDLGGGANLDVPLDLDDDRQGMDIEFEQPIDLGLDVDMGEGAYDYDIDLGAAYDDRPAPGTAENVPELEPAGNRPDESQSSRLSTPPSLQAESSIAANLTPRTAARISNLAGKRSALASAVTTNGPEKKKKSVRVIVDATTELDANQGIPSASQAARGANRDLTSILAPQSFLSDSRTVLRLLQAREDPIAHYLPTRSAPTGEQLVYVGPRGLGPELASMFLVPASVLRRQREAPSDDEGENAKQRKRARQEAEDDEDVEAGRRISRVPSLGPPSSRGGARNDDDLLLGREDDEMPFNLDDYPAGGDVLAYDDVPLDLEGREDVAALSTDDDDFAGGARRRASSQALSHIDDVDADVYDRPLDIVEDALSMHGGSTAGSQASRASRHAHGGGGPLDIFDTRSGSSRAGDSQGRPSQRSQRAGSRVGSRAGSVGARGESLAPGENVPSSASTPLGDGHLSRNTGKALAVLRKSLGPADQEQPAAADDDMEAAQEEQARRAVLDSAVTEVDGVKTLSFDKIAETTTKRAAASFFYELLLLGTKDYVKLGQPEGAYSDIQVQAKPKLFVGL